MTATLEAAEFGSGPPIAILHGMFGSGRNWAGIAQRLAAHNHVIAFDLRNHGASPWADTMTYGEMAEDIRAAMQRRGYHRYALLGHSMGGKVAMVATLTCPDTIERLMVVDIAPITYPPSYLAYVKAMRAVDLGPNTRRRDVDAQLANVIRSPEERAFLQQSLVFNGGAPHWRFNLAALETAMPALAGFPTFGDGTRYDGPALFIGGGRSDALKPEHEPAVTSLFPNATFARIADAGHWIHADQPERFLALVEQFLAVRILGDAD
ncbi:MAG TPA: alpha/beta fold hydrolase [Stellaceae bacterium]|nr:alpha/beta fold hydrolase [Stellaceae bacterium]